MSFVLKKAKLFVLVFFGFLLVVGGLYKLVPSSLVPEEDQGSIMAITNLPAASAMHRTSAYIDKLSKVLENNDSIQYNMSVIGFDLFTSSLKENAAASFIDLKPWGERKYSSFEVVRFLNMA